MDFWLSEAFLHCLGRKIRLFQLGAAVERDQIPCLCCIKQTICKECGPDISLEIEDWGRRVETLNDALIGARTINSL